MIDQSLHYPTSLPGAQTSEAADAITETSALNRVSRQNPGRSRRGSWTSGVNTSVNNPRLIQRTVSSTVPLVQQNFPSTNQVPHAESRLIGDLPARSFTRGSIADPTKPSTSNTPARTIEAPSLPEKALETAFGKASDYNPPVTQGARNQAWLTSDTLATVGMHFSGRYASNQNVFPFCGSINYKGVFPCCSPVHYVTDTKADSLQMDFTKEPMPQRVSPILGVNLANNSLNKMPETKLSGLELAAERDVRIAIAEQNDETATIILKSPQKGLLNAQIPFKNTNFKDPIQSGVTVHFQTNTGLITQKVDIAVPKANNYHVNSFDTDEGSVMQIKIRHTSPSKATAQEIAQG